MKTNQTYHPMLDFDLESFGAAQVHQVNPTLVYVSQVLPKYRDLNVSELNAEHFPISSGRLAYDIDLLVLVDDNTYRILLDKYGLGVEVMSLNFPNLEKYEAVS